MLDKAMIQGFRFASVSAIIIPVATPIRARKGGQAMIELLVALATSVLGSVIAHYVAKWLDGLIDGDSPGE